MITISVNNIDYNIPESWSDTTVKQHIDITEMKDRDESFRNVHMIHTYTGIPMELIRKMNVTDFHILINIMSFLKSPVLDKPINSFEFSGCTYYLVESMLKGETQDFLSVESVRKRFKDNEAKALPYIIAIVAKKEGESLDDYDPEKRAIDFLQLNYEIANSVWFFFCRDRKVLLSEYSALFEGTRQSNGSISKLHNEFSEAVGWFGVVQEISQSNPIIIHSIFKQKLEEFLSFLLVRNYRAELDNKVQQEQIKEARLKR